MAGLVPAIHIFSFANRSEDVDARHKAGHDEAIGGARRRHSADGRHGKQNLKEIARLRLIKLSRL
jgi:hypothetical protein